MDGTILLADDDAAVRKVLSRALTGAGCRVHSTALLTTLTRWVGEGKGDLVVTDVAMPDGNGIERLRQLRKMRPNLPVIVISAQNTIMTAIQAEEAEVFAYLPKPFDLPELLGRVGRALEKRSPPAVPAQPSAPEEELPLVGKAPVMQAMYQLLAKTINTSLPMHIRGETGTGKSLVAQVTHECSDRRSLPMIVAAPNRIEDADAVAALLNSAQGGSILFEEIGDLTLEAQRVLTQALDRPGERPPRIMSTTQRDLAKSMAAGEFRRDLFFRLCGVAVDVPPLRHRFDDIPLLANAFLHRMERHNPGLRFVASAPPDAVRNYAWPGNVRELRNVVGSAAHTVSKPELGWGDIADMIDRQQTDLAERHTPKGAILPVHAISESFREYFARHGTDASPPGLHLKVTREVEKPLIEAALASVGGNHSRCADILGISRNTLRKKVRELDIGRSYAH